MTNISLILTLELVALSLSVIFLFKLVFGNNSYKFKNLKARKLGFADGTIKRSLLNQSI